MGYTDMDHNKIARRLAANARAVPNPTPQRFITKVIDEMGFHPLAPVPDAPSLPATLTYSELHPRRDAILHMIQSGCVPAEIFYTLI